MDYGAIDLHKKDSQIRIVTEDGEVLDRRIATTRDRFTAVFEGRRPMRILLEASTESEWVAQHLETFGHTVIVADPTFAPMYSERSRRAKTDRSPRWPTRVSGCRSWCGAGAAAARS
jgi:transposase